MGQAGWYNSCSCFVRSCRAVKRTTGLLYMLVLSTVGWFVVLFHFWPFPTSIHVLVSLLGTLAMWTARQWIMLLLQAVRRSRSVPGSASQDTEAQEHEVPLLGKTEEGLPALLQCPPEEWSRARRLSVLTSSSLLMSILVSSTLSLCRSATVPPHPIPADPAISEKYFIAANLYNNEKVFPTWSSELVKLCQYRKIAHVPFIPSIPSGDPCSCFPISLPCLQWETTTFLSQSQNRTVGTRHSIYSPNSMSVYTISVYRIGSRSK